MSIKIKEIQENSLASKTGIEPDSAIISINNNEINDILDYQFYSAEKYLEIKIQKGGKKECFEINNDWTKPLGIIPEPHQCKSCLNNCIFCFISQMRPGLRKTLYVKDDDLVYSFIYGNYITLTNLKDRDFKKIIKQKLSPLYVSVHSTDESIRKKMMRYQKKIDIMKKLNFLTSNNIQLHTQIVTVPGWNDGEILKKTINDLIKLGENILSIGIVPVGLTKYRDDLPKLRKVSPQEAQEIIELSTSFNQNRPAKKVFCSDELFLQADIDIPASDYYEDFPQIENGIGMIRLSKTNFSINRDEIIKFLRDLKSNFVFVTAELPKSFIKKILAEFNKNIESADFRISTIKNNFLGQTVTVSGLLTARDISEQTKITGNEMLVLPSNIFNHEGKTLDDKTIDDFIENFNTDIIVIDELFEDWQHYRCTDES